MNPKEQTELPPRTSIDLEGRPQISPQELAEEIYLQASREEKFRLAEARVAQMIR